MQIIYDILHVLRITNMAMARIFGILSDITNAVGIYSQECVAELNNY
jgi:hypothetical protein